MRLDRRVIDFIKEKTASSKVRTIPEMKLLVEEHVRNCLFKDSPLPSTNNRRFFPENSDIG